MQSTAKDSFGIIYVVLGVALFLAAVGEFLVRLAIAGVALWLVSYGVGLMTGRSTLAFFWKSSR